MCACVCYCVITEVIAFIGFVSSLMTPLHRCILFLIGGVSIFIYVNKGRTEANHVASAMKKSKLQYK